MKKLTFDYENAVNLNLYFFRALGLWPNNGYKCDFYTAYAVLLVALQTSLFVFEALQLYRTRSNLDLFFTVLSTTVPHTLLMVKVYTFALNAGRFKAIAGFFNDDIFQAKNLRQEEWIQSQFSLWKKFQTFFTATAFLTMALWSLMPFLNGGYRKCLFTTMTFYPFPCDNIWRYVGVYIYENSIFLSSCSVGFNADLFQFATFIAVYIQFGVICDNFRHLGDTSEDFCSQLAVYITHHQKLTRFLRQFNEFCNYLLFFEFFLCTLVMAMVIFQINVMTEQVGGTVIIWSRVVSIFLYVFQIFAYCWCGTQIETMSEGMTYALFESNWVGKSTSSKKSLCILSACCSSSAKVSAFNLFYLTLDNFIKLLKSTWSFLTIMQQAVEPD